MDGQKAPVPLLKDMFGSERRKAKVRPLRLPQQISVSETLQSGLLPCHLNI